MIMYDFVFKGKYNPFLYFPLFCAFARLVEPNVKKEYHSQIHFETVIFQIYNLVFSCNFA